MRGHSSATRLFAGLTVTLLAAGWAGAYGSHEVSGWRCQLAPHSATSAAVAYSKG